MKFLTALFILSQFMTFAHAEGYNASLKVKSTLEYKEGYVPMLKVTGKNVQDIINVASSSMGKHQKIFVGEELYGYEGEKFSCYDINSKDAYCVFYVTSF